MSHKIMRYKLIVDTSLDYGKFVAMKIITMTFSLALLTFAGLEIQANHLLDSIDDIIDMLEELGLQDGYVDKVNETFSRLVNKYCDPEMTDESKMKKLQECQIRSEVNFTPNNNAVNLHSCVEESYKGITLTQMKDIECSENDHNIMHEELKNKTESCLTAKETNKTNPFYGVKDKNEIIRKLKFMLDSMADCFTQALL
jgi:hypothetical protein